MGLEFNNLIKANLNQKFAREIFSRFLKINKLPKNTVVSLAFVGVSDIKKFNNNYRGQNKSTDVLSFSDLDSEKFPEDHSLGEVIICYPVAKKQAKEQGHSVKKELEILFAHGLVHLLGYDHKTKKGAEKMRELENKILSAR